MNAAMDTRVDRQVSRMYPKAKAAMDTRVDR